MLLFIESAGFVSPTMSSSTPQRYLFAGGFGDVLLRKPGAADEIGITVVVVDQFFAIEEHEVDAVFRIQIGHQVGELHEDRGAAAAVVRAEEHALLPLDGIGIAIGERAGVVVRAEQDAIFSLRMPADDHVGHRHLVAAERILGLEFLQRHFAAELLEMLLQAVAAAAPCRGSR